MDTATVLEEAADLLLMRGVNRTGTFGHAPGGPRCVLGAIGEVQGVADMDTCGKVEAVRAACTPAAMAFRDHLREKLRAVSLTFITEWNDATADDFEVIDTLRHCAKDIRNQATGEPA